MKIRAEDNSNFKEFCINNGEVKYVSVLSVTDELANKINMLEKRILRQIKKKNWTRKGRR